MLQSVLTEEVRFKVVKIIFMMITPENSPRDLLMSSNQVKSWDVIEVQPFNAFGFYRFTSRCNSLALIYITKDFEWSPLSDFEKSVNFSFIHAWHPPACVNHTQGQLVRGNPGMRNINQKLLTRYIFRSCISAACKKVLLRNLVYPNHKRYKTILTGTFKLGRFLLLQGRTPRGSNFIQV